MKKTKNYKIKKRNQTITFTTTPQRDIEKVFVTYKCDLDPKIKLALEGLIYYPVPKNVLTKLLWRFLNIEVKFKSQPKLRSLMPRIQK